MKILYYNWDHIDGNMGGGVTVYQKNLISHIVLSENDDVFFINSGLTYDSGRLRIEKTDNSFGEKVNSFEIINSPVIAPVQQSAENIKNYLEDVSLFAIFDDFLKKNGPFDVIHFNNIEGLSLKVLSLKEIYPNTKFIYSVHNYFCVCSRVNLWKNDEMNCNKESFYECINCYYKTNYKSQRMIRKAELFSKPMKKITNILARAYNKFSIDNGTEKIYEDFEMKTVQAINCYMDKILTVSNRVSEIMELHGVDSNKMKVSYIGTKVAENQSHECGCNVNKAPFSIVYMGYMNKEKGFYFLLDALEKIPLQIKKNISVRFVARYNKNKNKKELERLDKLRDDFNSIEIINGYNSDNQKKCLEKINLGIVPVLWEDNLPQVAIEQISYGVPILVSDLGGAKEIVNNDKFVFEAGNADDFICKLINIMNNRNLLEEFWYTSKHLVTLKEHIEELRTVYEE